MRWRRWVVTAVIGISAGTGDAASADHEIVELRYAAPAECPARSVFEAAIVERTPNVRLGAPARRVFAITIEPTVDGFHGTLVVDDVADKELAAPRCEDLATALALVTALAIDPAAAPSAAEISRAAPPHAPPPRRPPIARRAPGAWAIEADLGGLVERGAGPGALVAAALEARATWRDRTALELAAIAGRDSTTWDAARARFTWLAARPAACRVWRRWTLAIGACGNLEIGAVRASGERIVNHRGLTRLWLAAGAHGRVRVPLSPWIFGQLQLGAGVPLVRDRYLFAPAVELHATPAVTGWAMLGIGVQFP